MPLVAIAFIIGGLVSMGMPGLSGFIAEFPIFMGVWRVQPWVAIISAISIVITASYIIRIIGKVFFGAVPAEFDHGEHAIGDVTVLDKVALVVICVIMVTIGVYPSVMAPLIESGVENILRLVGGV
jgi:NADH-quinone oxidoreductase subunit M